jgi:isoamylase
MNREILKGRSFPMGATVYPNGVNFCIFSKQATTLELLLFDAPDAAKPARVIPLDPKLNRTHHYWHVFISGMKAGQVYAYRAYGVFAPKLGHRFNDEKVLLDPYAKVVVGWETYSREAAILPGDNCAQALRGVVVDTSLYDWEDDQPLELPYSKTIIYELHVGGMTKNPNSGVSAEKRGTFAGLVEKIPYLQDLGITAVELMPIHQFDTQDVQPGLTNYWGYSTLAFFSPHRDYSSRKDPIGPVDEFRDMVKAFHKAGIEVILDVVFNHSAEGNHEGPTLSFKGLDNKVYYLLEDNLAYYANYSGCGNTLRANHEVVANLILDCLRYWVSEMHVDGFRFDLASVLSRNRFGDPLADPPILWSIEADPVLAGTKIIAEAWDAAGLYQVGSFIGDRFAEWNGPYRDDVRRFIKGDTDIANRLAFRILGSPDIYHEVDREPNRGINFVTCHDGFTLSDLVSYNQKYNAANKEDNRDGANNNYSWNCGQEGPTQDPKIEALRTQQIKNLLTLLFVSQGTPMILMGDEVQRTQQGNNNAYCQDSELSWFDWDGVQHHADLRRFVKSLIHFVQSHQIFSQEKRLEVTYGSHQPHLVWHGVQLGKPDWGDQSHSLAFTLRHPDAEEFLYVIVNAYWQPLAFELPGHDEQWCRIIDTSLPSPLDFCSRKTAIAIPKSTYRAAARSSVVLMIRPKLDV